MIQKIETTGGPAFPCPMSEQTFSNQDCAPFQGGMTLRDYFAAKVINGLIAAAPCGTGFGVSHTDTNLTYARAAYAVAEAMLNARKESQ